MNIHSVPGGHDEDGVYISPCLQELVDWLDDCLEKLDAGEENLIMSDPYFDSGLSDETVDALIADIDEDIATELGKYTGYHRNRSGANAPPEYHRLGPSARRALAEGCLQILKRHEVMEDEQRASTDSGTDGQGGADPPTDFCAQG